MSYIEEHLNAERKEVPFNPTTLSEFLYGGEKSYGALLKYLNQNEVPPYDPNMHDKSRVDLIKDAYKVLPYYRYLKNEQGFNNANAVTHLLLSCHHQIPGSAHLGMFLKFIELMGTQEQKQKYLAKCATYEVVGCYAQTELGHGSDVQNIETTAQFDEQTQEFIINTPSISAYKFWPGQIAFVSNHALVFAQLIIKKQKKGLFPFIVQTKDQNYEWLPTIEGGDIGPKIGFHAKQNGFLAFKGTRIPKGNLCSKFAEITPEGKLAITGDARIGYATMMHIREIISCQCPKLYGQALTIAVRYGLYRKQFKNKYGEEVTIMDYQCQKDKIIPKMAEYYAVITAGNKIQALSKKNSAKIYNLDMSLIEETHSCLSFSKSLFSEIVYDGIETCRRSCGGNGFSQYSGFPNLLAEYAANLTHEGENTVMYLQTAKYILKNHKLVKESKPVRGQSVKYIESMDYLLDFTEKAGVEINLERIRVLLAQGVCYLLKVCTSKLESVAKEEAKVVMNTKIGCRLQQLAKIHGYYYIFDAFKEAVMVERRENAKKTLMDLCLLFGIHTILHHGACILEGNFITQELLSSIIVEYERLLSVLRPSIIGLADGIGFPEKYIRSELVRGEPYQNYLDKARKSELNASISESAFLIRGVHKVIARM